MFSSLQDKLGSAFKKITGRGSLTPKDIEATMKEVRMALLEADVNFKVAKNFCNAVAEKAVGEEVLKSLSPGQQVIKVVHEELINMMGAGAEPLDLKVAPPAVIMVAGLQGSGKTTSCGKLARFLRDEEKRNPYLVPADVYRKAAIDQLQTLGRQLDIPVHDSDAADPPLKIVTEAIAEANNRGYDTVILDTAGRLQIDQEMMGEIKEIAETVSPHEILLVADAMTGQEAVNVATGFNEALELTGIVLTKLDGDARGGAALSMRAVTGKPIKFVGMGEKLDALETFHPERMASRILEMGDVLTFIEKASKEIDVEESLALQKKMKKNQFSLDDFLSQLRMIRKMGDMGSLMEMVPGMGKLAKQVDPEEAENELKKIEAIILSMTPLEREKTGIINGSRRKRIAKGSGTSVQDVNKLLKQFLEMKKMMQKMTKGGLGKLMNMMGGKGMPDISSLMKG